MSSSLASLLRGAALSALLVQCFAMDTGVKMLQGLSGAGADFGRGKLHDNALDLSSLATSTLAVHNFDQIVNHFPDDPSYGPPPTNKTFIQRYVVNDAYYKPGGPVILLNGGETSATGRFRTAYMTTGIIAELAQATGGIGVVLEHRYYGASLPVPDFSTDNLRWLTTDQSIADFAYFVQNVVIPGHEDEDLTAPGRPWILYGGSLAGAEVAFTVKAYGDIVYGGISSSGTVFMQTGFPEWYYNIQKYAPQDCVKTVEDIVDKIDYLILSKNTAALTKLKSLFGLQDLQDIRDFALTIAFPIGNPNNYPVGTWQELNWDPAVMFPDFNYFCGNLTNPHSPPNVTAVDYALSKYTHGERWTNLGNYAEYIKKAVVSLCPPGVSVDSNECYGTHNATAWDNIHDLTAGRAYAYQSCTEMGAYNQGPPPGRRALLSRSVQPDFTQRQCRWAYPKGKFNSIPPTPDLKKWNKFGGLSIQADRLAQVDGGEDPWLYACVHSPRAPKRKDTLLRPYYLIAPGGHHWDENGLLDISKEPAFIQDIHHYEIKFVKSWLADFGEWAKDKKKRTDLRIVL